MATSADPRTAGTDKADRTVPPQASPQPRRKADPPLTDEEEEARQSKYVLRYRGELPPFLYRCR
jgi:hypothetical protein